MCGFLVAHMRRTWGVAAFTCAAQLVTWRLDRVGLEREPPPAVRVAADARAAADAAHGAEGVYAAAFLAGMQPAVIPQPGGPPVRGRRGSRDSSEFVGRDSS